MKSEFDIQLKKLQRFCAYRDRSHYEVRTKLIEMKIYGDRLEQIMAELINENYLNEERFARSFVRGKFYQKRWGLIKIKQALKIHQLSDYILNKALSEIDSKDYRKTIRYLWDKKYSYVSAESEFAKRNKVYRYIQSRGFEADIIKSVIHELN